MIWFSLFQVWQPQILKSEEESTTFLFYDPGSRIENGTWFRSSMVPMSKTRFQKMLESPLGHAPNQLELLKIDIFSVHFQSIFINFHLSLLFLHHGFIEKLPESEGFKVWPCFFRCLASRGKRGCQSWGAGHHPDISWLWKMSLNKALPVKNELVLRNDFWMVGKISTNVF